MAKNKNMGFRLNSIKMLFIYAIAFNIVSVMAPGCSGGSAKADSPNVRYYHSESTDETLQNPKVPVTAFYNNAAEDTAKIMEVLEKLKDIDNINERVIAASQEFIGTPYGSGTLNIPPNEQLYVCTSKLDCVTFVETVMALAKSRISGNMDISDYLRNLQSIRYRNGEINGYSSRLHYISDWGIDNSRRGNFRELTPEITGAQERVKTIDFMTRNRHLYPALTEDTIFEATKEMERPLKHLRHFILPLKMVDKATGHGMKSGDIIAIVTNKPGLDVSHVGVLNIRDGKAYMTHASSKYKKVVNDTVPLSHYLEKQGSPGIRVFRLE